MKISRRNFLKKTLAGSLLLGAASLPQPLPAMIPSVEEVTRKKTQRVVLISLDGICVAGFHQANTPNLDALLALGALSTETRVVMPFGHFA